MNYQMIILYYINTQREMLDDFGCELTKRKKKEEEKSFLKGSGNNCLYTNYD